MTPDQIADLLDTDDGPRLPLLTVAEARAAVAILRRVEQQPDVDPGVAQAAAALGMRLLRRIPST
ncbi:MULTISPECIES: hypothetical protein [Actinomycetes]|uniref:hypothetical protein n=1 Tax=Actinomycetes TaxID=1760 RepID=UPI0033FDBF6D